MELEHTLLPRIVSLGAYVLRLLGLLELWLIRWGQSWSYSCLCILGTLYLQDEINSERFGIQRYTTTDIERQQGAMDALWKQWKLMRRTTIALAGNAARGVDHDMATIAEHSAKSARIGESTTDAPSVDSRLVIDRGIALIGDTSRSSTGKNESLLSELRIMASDAAMSQDNTPVPSTEGATQGQTMSEAELDQMQSILDFVYDYRTPEYALSSLLSYATLN